MCKPERMQMVRCMEYICRNLNNENILISWLSLGVADGDIPYGDTGGYYSEDLDYYTDDETFGELMELFLRLMARANKSGGLYCDRVCSADYHPKNG